MARDDAIKEAGGISSDAVFHGKLLIDQNKAGYRFSIDALLLADFITPKLGKEALLLDLGAGVGVVGLAALYRNKAAKCVLLERQASLFDLAQGNIAKNNMGMRAEAIRGDVKHHRALLKPDTFDRILVNPPFYSINQGRVCRNQEEEKARREHLGTLFDFLQATRWALHQKGRAALIYPASQLNKLFELLTKNNLRACRLRAVHPSVDRLASLMLVEIVKQKNMEMRVEAPLILEASEGRVTEEYLRIIAGE